MRKKTELESGAKIIKKLVPTFIFLPEVFSLHWRIRHPGNQLTMAL